MNIKQSIRLMSIACLSVALYACNSNSVKPSLEEDASEQGQVKADSSDVTYAYAIKAMQEKRYEEAVKLFKPFVEKNNAKISDWVNLGIAYRGVGEYKKSEKWLNAARSERPSNLDIINELGILKREQGKFKEAKAVYETALAMTPTHAKSLYNLGVLCDLYLRDYACAMDYYKRYQVQQPDDKNIKIWLNDLSKRSAQ